MSARATQAPDAEIRRVVATLICQNNFSSFTSKTLPSAECIEEVLFSPSSTALAEILQATIATVQPSSQGQIELDILHTKCVHIISFPENFAIFLGTHPRTKDLHENNERFDHTLYAEKLADVFWHIVLSVSDEHESATETDVTSRANIFTRAFAAAAVRRGFSPVLFDRFIAVTKDLLVYQGSENRNTSTIQECLRATTEGVFEGATNRKIALRKTGTVAFRLSGSWNAWMQTLVRAGERSHSSQAVIADFCVPNIQDGDKGASAVALLENDCRKQLRKYFLDTALTTVSTPRHHLRFIYTKLFPSLWNEQMTDERSSPPPPLLMETLKHVFAAWQSTDVVTHGAPQINETLFHSTMYALLFLKDEKKIALPPPLLAPLLSGVTARLQCVHMERQGYGMAVAAAFAAFFIDNGEVAANFLKNADFSSQLQKWLAEEAAPSLSASSVPRQLGKSSAGTRDGARQSNGHNLQEHPFVRTEILPLRETQALDPDAPFSFFIETDAFVSGGDGSLVPANVHVGQTGVSGYSSGGTLPAFGTQRLDRDDADVDILKTLRQSYESLMGIGKKANAQMHETQEAMEAGLRGIAEVLDAMKKELSKNGVNVKFPAHIDPLVPSLLPCLMSLSIYAPEEKTNMLYGIRYNIVVDLIVLSTKMALHTLSSMIYGSNYGVYQRVEMARAAGDAARELASIEVNTKNNEPSATDETSSEYNKARGKRIYPPIRTAAAARQDGSRSITISEGKNTRRWGNAVAARIKANSRVRTYVNMLGDVAQHFIASLLARLDADHFKFFQESDPYVPAEILRTLTAVFQGVSRIRHVVPVLCEQNIEFFFTVAMHHQHVAVRKQAWVVTGEIMRCWCGAPPALEATKDSYARSTGFTYTGSLMFSETWLTTLEVLQSLCMELERKKDPVFAVAALSIAQVRDLVFEQKDMEAMMSSQGGDIVTL